MTENKTTPLTPMMAQYLEIKSAHKDYLLFYRMGELYELFFDDAEMGSKLLDLTLTGKDCGLEERAPMCGIPYHAADVYISKLVSMGEKVAICEQLSDTKEAGRGLVRASGTEPLIRIMLEGQDADAIGVLAVSIAKILEKNHGGRIRQ